MAVKPEYRAFKQLINEFKYSNKENEDVKEKKDVLKTIKIEPKLIYNTYTKTLKAEFKLGTNKMYTIKNLVAFYENMLESKYFEYGSKLGFTHKEEAFELDSINILNYILKYAEITKYANEVAKEYSYNINTLNDRYITISNSGIDELFDIMVGKSIDFQTNGKEKTLYFKNGKPNIKFGIKKIDEKDYSICTNIDIYGYEIITGKKYIYILMNNILYRCEKSILDNEIKVIEVLKSSIDSEIKISKKELPEFFSLIYPRMRECIEIEKKSREEIEKYIPQDLFVKLYLDYDKKNHITAEIKFVYGDIEFNPILEEEVEIARDAIAEDEVLELFRKVGFMLDIRNKRLILVKDEDIYNFLSNDIEEFMQKFEVLATDAFKQKEIREPKIGSVGVKIENNLLNVDFSKMNFDYEEIKDIMAKYKLKKKFHRLKDGSFLKLESNDTIDFLDGLTSQIEVDFSKMKDGELNLPVFRSMYLDKILDKMDTSAISKDDNYKSMINNVEHKNIENIELPKDLNANLREYQKIGFEWLKVLDNYKFGGILADDMGLGKTLQIIAIILSYVQENSKRKPSLVICPSSLTLNWKNEINKFAPTLKSLVIRGDLLDRKKQINDIKNYDVVITSYDLLKRDIDLYEEKDFEFKYIIADEAQYIKNNNTQNAKAIKKVKGETRFALTGTPIENSLSELWSIFDFIMPGYLFSYRKFKENYELPIIKDESQAMMNKLKMLIEPFILRRIKKEVLTELPDKTITIINNEMQEEQQKIYSSYLQDARQEAIDEINVNGFEKSQIKILALLMRLRQICCHPSLFIDNYKGESSKLNQCLQLIRDAVDSGHKILLFSSYVGMFDIIENELKTANIKYFKLTGQTKVGDRIKLVDEFNENDEIKVFLISLKAGGTGLNLIGADMVIHYDPWWNLSAENQATDRTYRIGQKKNVQVYKLITENSIEEKIYELQERKASLVDNMLSTNETFINKLSKEDIMELFS